MGMKAPVQNTPTREYQIKAAFLYNFTQFVEWPEESFPSPDAPLVIGILGSDPFGTYLDQTVQGETIGGHPLIVRRYNSREEISNCHILFINIKDKTRMKQTLEKLRGKNILTVSDEQSFTKMGGIIELFTIEYKTRIRINPDAANAAGLSVSSKLLRLADKVDASQNN